MHVQNPCQPIVLASDWRQKADKDLDFTEPKEAPHVLELWRFGEAAMGRTAYSRITRLALFDHDAMPSTREAQEQRMAFVQYLDRNKPRTVLVVPTPDAQMGELPTALRGTHVWSALKAPDSLPAMRGCHYAYSDTTRIKPLYPMARRVKELQRWVMARWMRDVDKARLHNCVQAYSEVGPEYVDALASLAGRPLAVDLEFIPSKGKVTAIGLSDGRRAVSIPWDRFQPTGRDRWEENLAEKCKETPHLKQGIVKQLRALLAAPTPKYAHNFVADIPRLNGLGFTVRGTVMDTFAAHAIAFPELPHGLQAACASLFAVPPWKSLYKPRSLKHITRDDEEFWTCDPKALRAYNCQDAFMTWHLAQHVMPWVEMNPWTGEEENPCGN